MLFSLSSGMTADVVTVSTAMRQNDRIRHTAANERPVFPDIVAKKKDAVKTLIHLQK